MHITYMLGICMSSLIHINIDLAIICSFSIVRGLYLFSFYWYILIAWNNGLIMTFIYFMCFLLYLKHIELLSSYLVALTPVICTPSHPYSPLLLSWLFLKSRFTHDTKHVVLVPLNLAFFSEHDLHFCSFIYKYCTFVLNKLSIYSIVYTG